MASTSTTYPELSHLPPIPHVAKASPSTCVLDAFRIAIASQIASALPTLTIEQVFEGVHYGQKGHDFTVAMPRFRLKEKVDVVCQTVVDSFKPNEWIQKVTHQGNFLHFQLTSKTLLREVLAQVHRSTHETKSKKPEYGTNKSGEGKKMVIEFSSPNIAKQFHVGHLRSTIIGQFLTNVYRANGWDVTSLNYLGDWGTQFGLIAVGFEKYGSQESLKTDAIKHLYDVYVKINADATHDPQVKIEAAKFFKRMEDGDETALSTWRTWRELSIEKYIKDYAQLNVSFDAYTGESQVGKEWQDKALVKLEEMGLISDADGAKIVDLEKWKLAKAVVRKRDGTSIYLTRDIGGAIERYEKYKFDKMIYVVASQQDLHLAQFFKVLELMGFEWAKNLQHVNFGMVQGMSTRKGTAVFLTDIIREASNVMHEQMQKNEDKYAQIEDPERTSQEIGVTGIKIQDMQAKRINNYNFSWDRMTSFEGDTGPYLQYAHVRISSIERKNPNLLPLPPTSEIDLSLLAEHPKAHEMALLLGSYPDVVQTAVKTHEPSGVVTFAMRLSHVISAAWEVLGVKSESDAGRIESARARLWLFLCARDVLGASMRLLSLTPLDRM